MRSYVADAAARVVLRKSDHPAAGTSWDTESAFHVIHPLAAAIHFPSLLRPQLPDALCCAMSDYANAMYFLSPP